MHVICSGARWYAIEVLTQHYPERADVPKAKVPRSRRTLMNADMLTAHEIMQEEVAHLAEQQIALSSGGDK